MKISESKISEFGTILGVFAHPDDESWIAAGTLAKAAANNQRVVVITATMGEQGSNGNSHLTPDKLNGTRRKELQRALAILGITEHHVFHYPDGGLIKVPGDEGISKIATIMQSVQPDTVITFGPDGLTRHSDHITVAHWAAGAIKAARLPRPPKVIQAAVSKEWYEDIGREFHEKFNFFMEDNLSHLLAEEEIDIVFDIPDELFQTKISALRAHASQTERFFNELSPAQLRPMFGKEKFMRAS